MNSLIVKLLTPMWLIPALLHAFGLYLLYLAGNKKDFDPVRRIYYMYLSLSELLYCVGSCIRGFAVAYEYTSMSFYLTVLVEGGLYLLFIIAMLNLTADRFLSVYLSIRYNAIWSKSKAVYLLAFEIFVSLIFILILCVTMEKDTDKLKNALSIYFWVPSDWLFIVVAMATFGYIIKKFKLRRNKTVNTTTSLDENDLQQKREDKKRRRLFTLILGTFILFVVVPDQIIFIFNHVDSTIPDELFIVLVISYIVGMTSDALLYIVTLKTIRQILKEKFSFLPCYTNGRNSQRRQDVIN